MSATFMDFWQSVVVQAWNNKNEGRLWCLIYQLMTLELWYLASNASGAVSPRAAMGFDGCIMSVPSATPLTNACVNCYRQANKANTTNLHGIRQKTEIILDKGSKFSVFHIAAQRVNHVRQVLARISVQIHVNLSLSIIHIYKQTPV
jgi:hypothetical protein